MSPPPPRRRAARPPSRLARARARVRPGRRQVVPAGQPPGRTAPPAERPRERTTRDPAPREKKSSRVRTRPREKTPRSRGRGLLVAAWVLVVLAGCAAVAAAVVPDVATRVDPRVLSRSGSVTIASAFTWALAARTGGRPLVFGGLAVATGAAVVWADHPVLTTGAAVLTCVISAVLAVMVTVPGVRFVQAAREAVIAVLVAAVGAVGTVGFEPTVSLARFEYTTLALSLLLALGVVYRLGAGLHGLGRRGLLTVLVGSLLLAVTLAYAELLRRYGTPGLVEWLFDQVRWTRAHLGAFPRPIEALLGIPAITWGCHMRARRRQGWWVCAFGVAATAPVANALLNTTVSRTESVLASGYALAVGLLVGFVLIRVDLRLTGPRGRRGRRAEEATALRPEPTRTRALL